MSCSEIREVRKCVIKSKDLPFSPSCATCVIKMCHVFPIFKAGVKTEPPNRAGEGLRELIHVMDLERYLAKRKHSIISSYYYAIHPPKKAAK